MSNKYNGAFYLVKSSSSLGCGKSDYDNTSMGFDASLSNSIYTNSAEVENRSIIGFWQIKAIF